MKWRGRERKRKNKGRKRKGTLWKMKRAVFCTGSDYTCPGHGVIIIFAVRRRCKLDNLFNLGNWFRCQNGLHWAWLRQDRDSTCMRPMGVYRSLFLEGVGHESGGLNGCDAEIRNAFTASRNLNLGWTNSCRKTTRKTANGERMENSWRENPSPYVVKCFLL